MVTRSYADVIPLTDLKTNPAQVVCHASAARRPLLLTHRGRGVAVLQSVVDFKAAVEEREFMRAVVAGLSDLETGRNLSFAEALRRLGID